MNDQRTKSDKRLGTRAIAAVLVLLAALVCFFAIPASADAQTVLTVKTTDLNFTGTGVTTTSGTYEKTYDGTTALTALPTITATSAQLGIAAGDDVTVAVDTAAFLFKDVTNASANGIKVTFKLSGADKDKYTVPNPITILAAVKPQALTWSGSASAGSRWILRWLPGNGGN